MQQFDTVDVLRLEVEEDPVGLVNLVENPHGILGGWGWLTPVANTEITGTPAVTGDVGTLVLRTNVQQDVHGTTELLPVAAGQYVAARWVMKGPPAGAPNDRGFKARFEFYDAAKNLLSSSAQSAYAPGWSSTPRSLAAVVAPASTAFVKLRFDLYRNTASQPLANDSASFGEVTVAKAATAAALAGLGYLEPVSYLDVLGTSHEVSVERDELNLGILTATILDAALDPAVSDVIRPGRRVRLMALDPATAQFSPLFQGKVRNASVTYDARRTDSKRARITLSAGDEIAQAAGVTRTDGVATVAELPYVLEGAGVPWSCNGSGDQVGAAVVVSRNPNASALDQVAITRDSVRGFAWMSRFGVLTVWDAAQIPVTVAATFDEDDYSGFVPDYDTERCINTVTLKYLRTNLATGETVEVPYGPYVDQASVDEWGPHPAEFTVHGIVETSGNMAAFAAAVLAANATPVVRVNEITVPINTEADVAKALRDLYDLVTVANTNTAYSESMRITGVSHRITGGKWLTTYKFAGDGGVAPPIATPPPPAPSSSNASIGVTSGPSTTAAVNVYPRQGLAFLWCSVTVNAALAVGSTLFTLPAGCRPVALVGGDLLRTVDSVPIRVHIDANGVATNQAALAAGVLLRGQYVIPI